MAKGTTKVGVTGNYQYITEVNPDARMICGTTGISKKYSELTDDDIAKMIANGNKGFSLISKPAKPTT